MALNFPTNPTDGQIYTSGSRSWTYSSATDSWSGGGYSGVSGYSGISGYSGYSGISGYSGSGVSGYSGTSGYSGISGYSGVSGYSGSGISGYSGSNANVTSAVVSAALGYIPVNPAAATTYTALQTFTGATTALDIKLGSALEVVTVQASAATGTVTYDLTTQSIVYYTSNSTANWALNARGNSTNPISSLMAIGDAVSLVFMATNGSTGYYLSAFQVDGVTTSVKWQGGTAPTTGNANSIDVYTMTLIRTASATYTVLGSQTRFA